MKFHCNKKKVVRTLNIYTDACLKISYHQFTFKVKFKKKEKLDLKSIREKIARKSIIEQNFCNKYQSKIAIYV